MEPWPQSDFLWPRHVSVILSGLGTNVLLYAAARNINAGTVYVAQRFPHLAHQESFKTTMDLSSRSSAKLQVKFMWWNRRVPLRLLREAIGQFKCFIVCFTFSIYHFYTLSLLTTPDTWYLFGVVVAVFLREPSQIAMLNIDTWQIVNQEFNKLVTINICPLFSWQWLCCGYLHHQLSWSLQVCGRQLQSQHPRGGEPQAAAEDPPGETKNK